MKKSSNKYIWIADYTECDLLLNDTQVDRARVKQAQTAQEPDRPQLIFSIDPYSRLIMACRLSYEEERKPEH